MKKIVLVTIGDPAGIGSEISVKSCIDSSITNKCIPVIIGNINIIDNLLKKYKLLSVKINKINDFKNIIQKNNCINVFDVSKHKIKNFKYGIPNIDTALCSFDYIETALDLISKKITDKLVTAPISKEFWHKAKIKYIAHTEALADITGTKKYAMVFVNPKINVVLATRHIALKDVSKILTKEAIQEAISLGIKFLDMLNIKNKRIGICSLNPHSGDNGLIGNEEQNLIIPACEKFKNKNIKIIGPKSTDAIFNKALNNEIDITIAMYHDQGIIPLKIISYYECVNITVGLPFIRTSPGHGVGFDIAGKNKAKEDAMIQAIIWALRLKL